jgi:hypothetical protein
MPGAGNDETRSDLLDRLARIRTEALRLRGAGAEDVGARAMP